MGAVAKHVVFPGIFASELPSDNDSWLQDGCNRVVNRCEATTCHFYFCNHLATGFATIADTHGEVDGVATIDEIDHKTHGATTMTRTELEDIIRTSTPTPRINLDGLRRPLYAIAGAILLLALLLAPVAILAVEALYAQVLLKQRIDEMKTKRPG